MSKLRPVLAEQHTSRELAAALCESMGLVSMTAALLTYLIDNMGDENDDVDYRVSELYALHKFCTESRPHPGYAEMVNGAWRIATDEREEAIAEGRREGGPLP